MKKVFERIKKNKLRSVCIGLSVFLFGFITVSLFNNIGDTYAIDDSTDGEGCYVCEYDDESKTNYYWGLKSEIDSKNVDETGKKCDYVSFVSELDDKSVCNEENSNYLCYYCEDCRLTYFWGDFTYYFKFKNLIGVEATYSLCIESYESPYEVYFDPNGGIWNTNNDNNGSSKKIKLSGLEGKVYFSDIIDKINVEREGYILDGWMVESDYPEDEIIVGTIYRSYFEPSDMGLTFSANWVETNENNEDEVIEYTRFVYKVTYDLDGGHFIDGSTSRVSYVSSDKVIEELKTNPIKEGKKFKEWQLDGERFDFGNKIEQDITLKAVYEDISDDDKKFYCENDNDVLDLSTNKCYDVMKPDYDNNKFNYTLYSYKEGALFCYAYNKEKQISGALNFRTDIDINKYLVISGKNNSVYDDYEITETWVSSDTCLISTECYNDSSEVYPECEIRYDAIIYNVSDALLENDKNDEELTNNSKTGDTLIFVAWVIGIGALAYSVYYFKLKKENI